MHHQPIRGSVGAAAAPPVAAYAAMHTLRALEHLAVRPCSVPELAGVVGIGTRSARRLLHRLREEGYVVQDGGHRRRYRLTPRLGALGLRLLEDHPIRQAAAPVLGDLERSTGARASLWVAAGERPVRIPALGVGAACTVSEATDDSAGGPVRAVLSPARLRRRSYAFERGARTASAATVVLDHGVAVAAVELSGLADVVGLAPLHVAARRVAASLGTLVRQSAGTVDRGPQSGVD